MSVGSSPTIRRRRLGIELRHLREEAGKTIEEVAERLECSPSKVSRIETGRVPVRARDVREMLDFYGAPTDGYDDLIKLSRQSRERGWWHDYSQVLPDWFSIFVGLEEEATKIDAYSLMLVPGLLQTQEYYRAVIGASLLEASIDEIEQLLALRKTRQTLLSRDHPPRYWVVVDEAAIRRVVGGPEVMRGQLHHLVDMAQATHINIQVLPFSAGAHPSMTGAFVTFGFAEVTDPRVVYVEELTNALYLEKPEQVERYSSAFDQLRAAALSPNDSVALMSALAKEI